MDVINLKFSFIYVGCFFIIFVIDFKLSIIQFIILITIVYIM